MNIQASRLGLRTTLQPLKKSIKTCQSFIYFHTSSSILIFFSYKFLITSFPPFSHIPSKLFMINIKKYLKKCLYFLSLPPILFLFWWIFFLLFQPRYFPLMVFLFFFFVIVYLIFTSYYFSFWQICINFMHIWVFWYTNSWSQVLFLFFLCTICFIWFGW